VPAVSQLRRALEQGLLREITLTDAELAVPLFCNRPRGQRLSPIRTALFEAVSDYVQRLSAIREALGVSPRSS
jgi:hypothetical protein